MTEYLHRRRLRRPKTAPLAAHPQSAAHGTLPAAGTDGREGPQARAGGNTREGAQARAGGNTKDAALVQAMFDRVAPRYDLANTVLSFGRDAHWRRVAARAARPAGASVLDVAAGTGALSRELALLGASRVVALDLSHRMLAAGVPRRPPRVHLCNGDALRLPFADSTFHVTTIAFGLRNLPDPDAGLKEFARVTRPGGRLVILEFSRPTWAPFRRLYTGYLRRTLPLVASALSPAPAAYRYLADSILRWPDADGLATWISRNGWESVDYRLLTGGIVAMHRATREGGRLSLSAPSPAGA